MKRLNRKKLIVEFEFLRQGFRDAHDFLAKEPAGKISMAALHANANRCVVELGGESVQLEKKSQPVAWKCPRCGYTNMRPDLFDWCLDCGKIYEHHQK